MAEGLNEKKVYFTRFRKRSLDSAGKSTDLVNDEEDSSVVIEPVKEEPVIDLTSDDEVDKCDTKLLECAICLQNCIHPARLPCGHIFCFLCVKGAAHGNKKCAMCRNPIPHNYFHNPELLETPEEIASVNQEGYEWFYEGRQGGWWQYEERMSKEIEDCYKNGIEQFETLICGNVYTINLVSLIQYKTDAPWQKRRIVRDKPSNITKRGIAGIQ